VGAAGSGSAARAPPRCACSSMLRARTRGAFATLRGPSHAAAGGSRLACTAAASSPSGAPSRACRARSSRGAWRGGSRGPRRPRCAACAGAGLRSARAHHAAAARGPADHTATGARLSGAHARTPGPACAPCLMQVRRRLCAHLRGPVQRRSLLLHSPCTFAGPVARPRLARRHAPLACSPAQAHHGRASRGLRLARLQARRRALPVRAAFHACRAAARCLQRWVRARHARRAFLRRRAAAITLQAAPRAVAARRA